MELNHLKTIVREVTGTNVDNPTRHREVVEARAIYFYLARKFTKNSLQVIGKSVNRDHASVIHGLKQLNNWKDHYTDFGHKVVTADAKAKYIQRNIIDEAKSVDEIICYLDDLENENTKLRNSNVDLLLQLSDIKEYVKKQDKYLKEAGYEANMARLRSKYSF